MVSTVYLKHKLSPSCELQAAQKKESRSPDPWAPWATASREASDGLYPKPENQKSGCFGR